MHKLFHALDSNETKQRFSAMIDLDYKHMWPTDDNNRTTTPLAERWCSLNTSYKGNHVVVDNAPGEIRRKCTSNWLHWTAPHKLTRTKIRPHTTRAHRKYSECINTRSLNPSHTILPLPIHHQWYNSLLETHVQTTSTSETAKWNSKKLSLWSNALLLAPLIRSLFQRNAHAWLICGLRQEYREPQVVPQSSFSALSQFKQQSAIFFILSIHGYFFKEVEFPDPHGTILIH